MVRIINTANLPILDPTQTHFVYNGLDTTITMEIFHQLKKLETPESKIIYKFERALQAPALEIMLHGLKVDMTARSSLMADLVSEKIKLENWLNELAFAIWDKPLNPNSSKQVQEILYEKMKLPPVWAFNKQTKRKTKTTGREALEKLSAYIYARPLVKTILALRDTIKKLSVLHSGIDEDKRIRCSINIAGTETGRWSSSENIFRTGANLQNITDKLRRVFVPDAGKKFAYIDLEQAESRLVGFLAYLNTGRQTYLDACEGGDLHTTVSRMVWPTLPWTGELKEDKKIAERKFYRDYSYRDMAKRGGHGCLTVGHDVLTPSGWMDISLVPNGLPIMAWNHDKNTTQWEIPTHWERKPWEQDLYKIKNRTIDMVVTSDHRMPIITRKGKLRECSAENLFLFKNDKLNTTIKFVGGTDNISEQQIRLAAILLVRDHKKIKRKKFTIQEEIYFKKSFPEIDFQRSWEAVRDFVTLDIEPSLKMLSWPQHSLRIWVKEFCQQLNKYGWFSASNQNLLFSIYTIFRFAGLNGAISARGFRPNKTVSQYISPTKMTKIQGHGQMVYCPTTPSGGFIVRRNNLIMCSLNTNYYGTPYTMAKHLKVSQDVMENFQQMYFKQFPEIPAWHKGTARELQTKGYLTTPLGRRRHFFSRLYDDATLREAIAFAPQSTIADIMNKALYNIWKLSNKIREIELLLQVHDAALIQYPEELEDELLPLVLQEMIVPITGPDRTLIIPVEASVGWNWGKFDYENLGKNPNGLKKWNGHDDRDRADDKRYT